MNATTNSVLYRFYHMYLRLALLLHCDNYVFERKSLWLQRSTNLHPRSQALYTVQQTLARGEYVFCHSCGWTVHFQEFDHVCENCFLRQIDQAVEAIKADEAEHEELMNAREALQVELQVIEELYGEINHDPSWHLNDLDSWNRGPNNTLDDPSYWDEMERYYAYELDQGFDVDPQAPWAFIDADGNPRYDCWNYEDLDDQRGSSCNDETPNLWKSAEDFYEQDWREEAENRCYHDDHRWCHDGPFSGHYSEVVFGDPEQQLFHQIQHRSRCRVVPPRHVGERESVRLQRRLDLLPPRHSM